MCELRAAVSVLHTVDVGPQNSRIFLCALVVSTEVLGQLLIVVEHGVRLAVFPDDCVQPQLLHEEHLVGEVLWTSCEKEGKKEGRKEETQKERRNNEYT